MIVFRSHQPDYTIAGKNIEEEGLAYVIGLRGHPADSVENPILRVVEPNQIWVTLGDAGQLASELVKADVHFDYAYADISRRNLLRKSNLEGIERRRTG